MASNNQGNIADPDQHSPKSDDENNSKAEEENAPLVNRLGLQQLVHQFDPSLYLDEDVEQMIIDIADQFVETSLNSACHAAIRRGSSTIEVQDVRRQVKRILNINVPLCQRCVEERNSPAHRAALTEEHLRTQDRMREIFAPKKN